MNKNTLKKPSRQSVSVFSKAQEHFRSRLVYLFHVIYFKMCPWIHHQLHLRYCKGDPGKFLNHMLYQMPHASPQPARVWGGIRGTGAVLPCVVGTFK